MNFTIGQKVVCVDDQFFLLPDSGVGPIKGSVYCIREVRHVGSVLALGLVGVGEHGYYRANRFRPLDKCKQDAADRQHKEGPAHV